MAKQDNVQLQMTPELRARLQTLLEGGKKGISAADLVALTEVVDKSRKALHDAEQSAKTEKVGNIKKAVAALRKAIDDEFAGLTEYMIRIVGDEEPQILLKRATEKVVAFGIKSARGGNGNGSGDWAGMTRKQKRTARKVKKEAIAAGKTVEQAVAEAKEAAAKVE